MGSDDSLSLYIMSIRIVVDLKLKRRSFFQLIQRSGEVHDPPFIITARHLVLYRKPWIEDDAARLSWPWVTVPAKKGCRCCCSHMWPSGQGTCHRGWFLRLIFLSLQCKERLFWLLLTRLVVVVPHVLQDVVPSSAEDDLIVSVVEMSGAWGLPVGKVLVEVHLS